jgi:hypothetical protein
MNVWQSFWLIVEVFFFMAYLIILFQIVGDLFRDRELGGGAKAVWVFFLLTLTFLTALVYLVVRGKGMGERQITAARAAQHNADEYIREVAGASPAQQIETAKKLLDAGAVTPAEFATLKAEALAGRA